MLIKRQDGEVRPVFLDKVRFRYLRPTTFPYQRNTGASLRSRYLISAGTFPLRIAGTTGGWPVSFKIF